jgi:hypothetical protein
MARILFASLYSTLDTGRILWPDKPDTKQLPRVTCLKGYIPVPDNLRDHLIQL